VLGLWYVRTIDPVIELFTAEQIGPSQSQTEKHDISVLMIFVFFSSLDLFYGDCLFVLFTDCGPRGSMSPLAYLFQNVSIV
jgi:hypothetical protein